MFLKGKVPSENKIMKNIMGEVRNHRVENLKKKCSVLFDFPSSSTMLEKAATRDLALLYF